MRLLYYFHLHTSFFPPFSLLRLAFATFDFALMLYHPLEINTTKIERMHVQGAKSESIRLAARRKLGIWSASDKHRPGINRLKCKCQKIGSFGNIVRCFLHPVHTNCLPYQICVSLIFTYSCLLRTEQTRERQ